MKKNISTIGAATLLAVTVTGCNFLDKAYTVTPGAAIGTNTIVTASATNIQAIVLPAQTNLAGQVTAPAVTNTVLTITPATTNFVPVFAPSTVAPIAGVNGGIYLLGAMPFPFAGTAAALLAFLYSTYAAWRNKSAANTAQQVASSLVNGIEAFRVWAQTTPEGKSVDGKLKDFIQTHAEYAGVLNELSAIVNNQTGNTVP